MGTGVGASSEAVSSFDFDTFYADTVPIIYGYLLRLCGGDHERTCDLTQDTWVKLVDELDRGHVEKANLSWLVAVARSRYLDAWRSDQRRERNLRLVWHDRTSHELVAQPDTAPDTEAWSIDSETLAIDPEDPVGEGGMVRATAVAYRDLDDARQAFEAVADAGFPSCLAGYTEAEGPNTLWSGITREPGPNQVGVHDDGTVWIEYEGGYAAPDGTRQPDSRVVDVFMRVGPIIIGIDASMDQLTDAQLQTFVDLMIERAQAALVGAPIPN